METVIRNILFIYAVDVDPSDEQAFVYRGRRYRWSTLGGHHICLTRHDPNRLVMKFWHGLGQKELAMRLHTYLQEQR
jgi:hypothetical protein